MEEGKDRSTVQKEVTDQYSLRGRVFHRIREDILADKGIKYLISFCYSIWYTEIEINDTA